MDRIQDVITKLNNKKHLNEVDKERLKRNFVRNKQQLDEENKIRHTFAKDLIPKRRNKR